MRRIILVLIPILFFFPVLAQNSALVKGRIVGANSQQPLSNVEVRLPSIKMMTFTNDNGEFSFSPVRFGTYDLELGSSYKLDEPLKIAVDKAVVDLGSIEASSNDAITSSSSNQLPTIALEESESSGDDDGVSNQSISGVLTASRDPFLSAAAYTFGPMRYQLRGYKRDQLDVYMNGLPMNDAESGFAIWGQWGGLNDVFRNQTLTFGLQPAEQGFGGLQGLTQIDATAASQRKQTRITYSLSNRSYRHRTMVTYSTGLMQNGWAFSASASRRWAQKGYVPGTSYDGYSYYLGISKKLSKSSMLHFTTFGAPTQRGKAMPTTQEAMDLAGSHFYNPNWGLQDGKVRNSRINNTFMPTAILSYEYRPDYNTLLNIAAAYQQGFVGNSSVDWYNAQDPRPDYYRKLPSYFTYLPGGTNPLAAAEVKAELENNPDLLQLDWQRMYDANRMNIDSNGNRQSMYVIGQDRDDIKKMSLAANFQKAFGEHLKFFVGANVVNQNTESYRKLLDLLGGDYYVNLNQFAERTYVGNKDMNQNDLNNPNRQVKEGEKYSYDYRSRFLKSTAWTQFLFNFNRFDFFLTGKLGYDVFSREGIYQNGLFPTTSSGKSAQNKFLTYAAKGGITFKINGRNYIYANGGIMTNAPTFDNTFLSPRTRNITIANPNVEKVMTLEGGYLLHSPNFSGRLSGFVTEMKDFTEIKRFYHEDFVTFVNYVMQHVGMRNLGAEFALQAKVSPSLSATLVASYIQAFYTNRPDVSIFPDNDTTSKVGSSTAYLKNYYVAAGPQTAATLGINYRSPKFWYANINFNYYDRNYVDVNPSRRTESAVDLLEPGSEKWHAILDQEKLPSAFTIDVFAGKSFALNKLFKKAAYGQFIYLNVGVSNILNNKNIKTGGFEQLRFDYSTREPNRFANKYFYAYGANYFVNISFKF